MAALLAPRSTKHLLDAMSADFVGFTIVSAVRRGDLQGVRNWLHGGGDPNFVVKPESGFTVLMFATFSSARANGVLDVVRLLLAHGSDPNYATTAAEDGEYEAGRSALYFAAVDRNVPAVDLLVAFGAHVDAATLRRGWTPLAAVCATRPPRQLLWSDDDDDAPLDAAVADRLLSAGASCVRDMSGSYPIHHAIRRAHYDLVKSLVVNEVDVDVLDADDATPLALVAKDDVRTLKLLRAAGASDHVAPPPPRPRRW